MSAPTMPTPTDGGRTYAFPIRDDVKFQDGSPLTADDVAASWNKIIDPPEGIISVRRGYYSMVDKDRGARSRKPSSSTSNSRPRRFCRRSPILMPSSTRRRSSTAIRIGTRRTSWVRARSDLRNIRSGQSISGVRNPDYYRPGLPYLDGFIGIFADKQAVRVAAIKGDRAAIEFRGFPPATRDELVAALGDKITVQESDWNCGALITPNHDTEAVRRCPGAPRLDAGDRPLARRGADVADHGLADGRRRRSSPARRWPRPRRNWSSWPAIGRTSRNRAPKQGGC